MVKDFDAWAQQKKHFEGMLRPLFSAGEVWWCRFGINLGDEQDGKGAAFTRPVLVLRKFNARIFLGVPLSTQNKPNPFYYPLNFKGREQSVILSQIRLFDAKRLADRMGKLPGNEVEKIRERIRTQVI